MTTQAGSKDGTVDSGIVSWGPEFATLPDGRTLARLVMWTGYSEPIVVILEDRMAEAARQLSVGSNIEYVGGYRRDRIDSHERASEIRSAWLDPTRIMQAGSWNLYAEAIFFATDTPKGGEMLNESPRLPLPSDEQIERAFGPIREPPSRDSANLFFAPNASFRDALHEATLELVIDEKTAYSRWWEENGWRFAEKFRESDASSIMMKLTEAPGVNLSQIRASFVEPFTKVERRFAALEFAEKRLGFERQWSSAEGRALLRHPETGQTLEAVRHPRGYWDFTDQKTQRRYSIVDLFSERERDLPLSKIRQDLELWAGVNCEQNAPDLEIRRSIQRELASHRVVDGLQNHPDLVALGLRPETIRRVDHGAALRIEAAGSLLLPLQDQAGVGGALRVDLRSTEPGRRTTPEGKMSERARGAPGLWIPNQVRKPQAIVFTSSPIAALAHQQLHGRADTMYCAVGPHFGPGSTPLGQERCVRELLERHPRATIVSAFGKDRDGRGHHAELCRLGGQDRVKRHAPPFGAASWTEALMRKERAFIRAHGRAVKAKALEI